MKSNKNKKKKLLAAASALALVAAIAGTFAWIDLFDICSTGSNFGMT